MIKRLPAVCVALCGLLQPFAAQAADSSSGDFPVRKYIRGIEPYRQMYLMGTFNDKNNYHAIYGPTLGTQYREAEVKFQISFQALLFNVGKYEVRGAYTQQSYWQLFNQPLSAPFRESNYEPELFVRWKDDKPRVAGLDAWYKLGFDHQSNGRSLPFSRSWNRLYGEVTLQDPNDKWLGAMRVWWRIPEKASQDDNPNITQYYGYWQFDGRYSLDDTGDTKLHMMLRDNLRVRNRGAVQLDISWKPPVFTDFSLYAQAFGGFGENLIDHQHINLRVGAGILLANW